jgi:hypothetical protein
MRMMVVVGHGVCVCFLCSVGEEQKISSEPKNSMEPGALICAVITIDNIESVLAGTKPPSSQDG